MLFDLFVFGRIGALVTFQGGILLVLVAFLYRDLCFW